ncbi:hypothetical protein SAMN05421850_104283 [Lutimaribacter saemankumensis]|uniref:Uncharacterized protein n=1 Tax=Lutimaribacter saemankumensis TaxID=490829 RepID=A0A1G8MRR9_9RHOB|nr:hypothetical protein SAMN05421850_104283 [Lutimaribacter saemankumensis]
MQASTRSDILHKLTGERDLSLIQRLWATKPGIFQSLKPSERVTVRASCRALDRLGSLVTENLSHIELDCFCSVPYLDQHTRLSCVPNRLWLEVWADDRLTKRKHQAKLFVDFSRTEVTVGVIFLGLRDHQARRELWKQVAKRKLLCGDAFKDREENAATCHLKPKPQEKNYLVSTTPRPHGLETVGSNRKTWQKRRAEELDLGKGVISFSRTLCSREISFETLLLGLETTAVDFDDFLFGAVSIQ